MRVEQLDSMIRGWFVGNFIPNVYQTEDVEVAIQNYPSGTYEPWHYHKIATEITVIVVGEAEMNGQRYNAGKIVVMEPGEGTDFKAVTDVTTVVVKLPSVKHDKYLKGD